MAMKARRQPGAAPIGDEQQATRSDMNWDSLDAATLAHARKLGQFRLRHPALARGEHRLINEKPYAFARVAQDDAVIAVPEAQGAIALKVHGVFADGTTAARRLYASNLYRQRWRRRRERGRHRPAGESSTMSTYDILVVGGAGIDTIVRVPDLQLPVADSVHVPPIRDYVAHTGNGVALGCHALGLRCKFIDFIGDDAQGAAILQRYKDGKARFFSTSSNRPARGAASTWSTRKDADCRCTTAAIRKTCACRPTSTCPTWARRAMRTFPSWAGWPQLFDDAQVCGTTVSTDLHDWDGVNPHHKMFALRADLVFLSTAALDERTRRRHARDSRARPRAGRDRHGRRATARICWNGAATTVRHFPCAQAWTCPWWTRMAPATRSSPPSCTPGWMVQAWTPPCAAAPSAARLPARRMARMNGSSSWQSCMTYIKTALAYDLIFYQA